MILAVWIITSFVLATRYGRMIESADGRAD